MQNKRTLWLFPLLTQLFFSVLAMLFGSISITIPLVVFICATLPAFFFSLICIKFNYHHQHLFPIAFFSGLICFFYGLVIIPFGISGESDISLENSLMTLLYALTYALAAMLYTLLVLRPFLRKRH